MSTGTVVSLLAVTAFVGALGVSITYFGRVELIAGYDPERVTDEDELASFIGTNVLYVAALTALVAIVEYTDPFSGAEVVWLVFLAGVFGLTVRMIVGARRYEEPS